MVEGLENVDCEMTRLRRPLKLGSREKVHGASDSWRANSSQLDKQLSGRYDHNEH